MSDPNRATLITVGAPKSAKANVIKTVRLTINLDESNESKYPELNYKELVFAEERKNKVQNGKTPGLDPFSDNDEDVERVARKFEQKYGGKSTYSRKKARSKQDDFADIGAGYDENDSFIDNTDGYDEMIPPECDTLYGGFYINSGSLEFKTVSQEQADNETNNRRNKRRISSSSSEEESSESSSESESGEEKDTKPVPNGDIDSHKTEHRKKKNKNIDKTKAKKVRRTDSSAATSGKLTSDENNHGDAESADCADSRTSDSLTSKPAPSSENPVTSDSSRDMEAKTECKLPAPVSSALDTLEALVARSLLESAAPATTPTQLLANSEPYLLRLEQALKTSNCDTSTRRAAWARAATCIGVPRAKLMARGKQRDNKVERSERDPVVAPATTTTTTTTATTASVSQPTTTASTHTTTVLVNNKRKHAENDDDYSKLTDEQREANIVETLQRLKALIDERKPSMLANYNAECERVQEERKKLQIAQAAEGAPHVEKRLPKRRFPWCPKSRALLARLRRLARDPQEAAMLLAKRALPLFPNGFVRMPTLLRQAEVKEIKVTDVKRQRLGSTSQPAVTNVQTNQQTTPALPLTDPIQFPSSLTVTTSLKTSPDKMETDTDDKYKTNTSMFSSIKKHFPNFGKDLIVEKDDNNKKEDLYIPPNNIGSITITPVPNQTNEKKNSVIIDKAPSSSTGLIRVKSPAALNDMVNKKDLKPIKKLEKSLSNPKDKRVESPLHIDTSFQPTRKDPSPRDSNYKKDPSPRDSNYKKDPSPKDSNYKRDPSPKDSNSKKDLNSKDPYRKDPSPKSKDEIPQKQIENMKIAENNIPRPALIPVQHSPTFAKPDKRPLEGKKKKDIIIIPEVDPLSDLNEPVNVDDSSSDVEVIEDKQTDKSDSVVPSKDKVKVPKVKDGKDEESAEIDTLMKSLREMEHSQEPKFNSNSYSGVITSAKHGSSTRCHSNKLTERTSLNKMDGSKTITG